MGTLLHTTQHVLTTGPLPAQRGALPAATPSHHLPCPRRKGLICRPIPAASFLKASTPVSTHAGAAWLSSARLQAAPRRPPSPRCFPIAPFLSETPGRSAPSLPDSPWDVAFLHHARILSHAQPPRSPSPRPRASYPSGSVPGLRGAEPAAAGKPRASSSGRAPERAVWAVAASDLPAPL